MIGYRYPWVGDAQYSNYHDWGKAVRRDQRKREAAKWLSRATAVAVGLLWLRLLILCVTSNNVGVMVMGMLMVLATLGFFIMYVVAWTYRDQD